MPWYTLGSWCWTYHIMSLTSEWTEPEKFWWQETSELNWICKKDRSLSLRRVCLFCLLLKIFSLTLLHCYGSDVSLSSFNIQEYYFKHLPDDGVKSQSFQSPVLISLFPVSSFYLLTQFHDCVNSLCGSLGHKVLVTRSQPPGTQELLGFNFSFFSNLPICIIHCRSSWWHLIWMNNSHCLLLIMIGASGSSVVSESCKCKKIHEMGLDVS